MNRSLMNLFIEIGSSMNMFIEIGSFMNRLSTIFLHLNFIGGWPARKHFDAPAVSY
jgi:hypothetical protein